MPRTLAIKYTNRGEDDENRAGRIVGGTIKEIEKDVYMYVGLDEGRDEAERKYERTKKEKWRSRDTAAEKNRSNSEKEEVEKGAEMKENGTDRRDFYAREHERKREGEKGADGKRHIHARGQY